MTQSESASARALLSLGIALGKHHFSREQLFEIEEELFKLKTDDIEAHDILRAWLDE